MANAFKVLFQGQLGSSVVRIAGPASSASWIIKMITAVNTDSSTRSFGLYVNGTGAANQITSGAVSLARNGGQYVWDSMTATLGGAQGDYLAAGADAGSKVTLTVFGDEVT